GVYVPAMSRKMLEWSIRRRSAVARGDQVRRGYSAETPNRIDDDDKNTAVAHVNAVPSAITTSSTPRTIDTGRVPAWIQPRRVGFSGRAGTPKSSAVSVASVTSDPRGTACS